MAAELMRGDVLYRPSRFWRDLNEINHSQLRIAGFENFKRTINQNYFNWGPNSFEDNQLRNLLYRWHQTPNPTPILATLRGDFELRNMFNTNMLDSEDKAKIYAFFVGLLWWFTSLDDPMRLTERLSEPTVGNPVKIELGGRLISQDLANSIREHNTIRTFAPAGETSRQTIMEIGAGYGRLAYVFQMASQCTYVIFDIPPALYLSERYLRTVLPQKRIFAFRPFKDFGEISDELSKADIGFFSANQIALFPRDYFDIAISVSALHEMRDEQIRHYLSRMCFLAKHIIYLKNWRRWHNSADDVTITETTFELPKPWLPGLDRTDEVQDLFSEKLYIRT